MNQKFLILSAIIRSRRAIFPQNYEPGQIPEEVLNAVLENARWAPNHKKTEPWRYVVITGTKLNELSEFLSNHYKNKTAPENFDAVKMKKAGEKPLQSAAVIAICIHRSPESVIPAWEETAAVACSVQNMWLSCSALEIGCYWSTPEAIYHMNEFLGLGESESCIGLFYMGWTKHQSVATNRKSVGEISRKL
jgi:nitroreductase